MPLSQAFPGPKSPVLTSFEIQAAAITAAQLTHPGSSSSSFLKRKFNSFSTILLAQTHNCSHPTPSPDSPKPSELLCPGPQVDGALPATPLRSTVSTPATSEPSGVSQLPLWCHPSWIPATPQARHRFRGGVWARVGTSADSSASRDTSFLRPNGPGLPRQARGRQSLRGGAGLAGTPGNTLGPRVP